MARHRKSFSIETSNFIDALSSYEELHGTIETKQVYDDFLGELADTRNDTVTPITDSFIDAAGDLSLWDRLMASRIEKAKAEVSRLQEEVMEALGNGETDAALALAAEAKEAKARLETLTS